MTTLAALDEACSYLLQKVHWHPSFPPNLIASSHKASAGIYGEKKQRGANLI